MNIKFIKYYKIIINNLNKELVFYKYYSVEKSYKDAKNYLLKIVSLLMEIKTNRRKNIYVSCDKSFEMYVIIFSILLTNNVWIPLSKSLPKNRILGILKQVPPDLFIYDTNDEDKILLFKKYKSKCINFNDIYKINLILNYKSINKLINSINFEKTAFIYFTSGSTGEAKGIKISHKNIISDVYDQIYHLHKKKHYKSNQLIFGDYYDTAFSIFFDIYFPAIYMGATISPGIKVSEIYLPINHIKKNKVNILIAVPSTIQRIKDYYQNKKINHNFDIIIMTGEPFYLNLLDYIFKHFNFIKLFNCYGGTEMSNWVYYHECNKNDLINYKEFNLVPIGKKFRSVKSKIVNKELIIQGPSVALGYLNKKLNKNKFFLKKNNSLFNTGDMIVKKYGRLICKGRKDHMVKIRGYRVEIPYIEAIIRKIKEVEQAIILEKKEKNYSNHLICILKLNKRISELKIRESLINELPNYMKPKKIFFLKNMPLNSNGKIDRKKLLNKYGN
jgi:D-alanine--poly(phosphoribitol) ligase subunit 1